MSDETAGPCTRTKCEAFLIEAAVTERLARIDLGLALPTVMAR